MKSNHYSNHFYTENANGQKTLCGIEQTNPFYLLPIEEGKGKETMRKVYDKDCEECLRIKSLEERP